jgi:hypothetical protein
MSESQVEKTNPLPPIFSGVFFHMLGIGDLQFLLSMGSRE